MAIFIDQISKRYGDHVVVNHVSLDVAEGELVVLLGSSGSGKESSCAAKTSPTCPLKSGAWDLSFRIIRYSPT
jgi:ABC-2 type transport system ATP-binding protein